MRSIGMPIPIQVYYLGYEYEMMAGALNWGTAETFTREIGAANVLRFSPPIAPPGIGNRAAIAFDADVEFETGEKLAMPKTLLSTRLLLNDAERVSNAERNERNLGDLWLRRTSLVRARPNEIAGVYISGSQLELHLHDDEFVIERLLSNQGFRVAPNKHTRYALGFIRRFGGFSKARYLTLQGGAGIVEALNAHRVSQSGFFEDQIVDYLKKSRFRTGKSTEVS